LEESQVGLDVGVLKRTTFIVRNAKESAAFYTSVFGWSIWYDDVLNADYRFPPSGAKDKAEVHLIILQANDPKLGKLGLLQYIKSPFEIQELEKRDQVRMCEPILVIETNDIEGVHDRAVKAGATIVSAPVDWYVPGPEKESSIHLRTVSFFDPNGIYMEVSDHPSRN